MTSEAPTMGVSLVNFDRNRGVMMISKELQREVLKVAIAALENERSAYIVARELGLTGEEEDALYEKFRFEFDLLQDEYK